MADYEPIGEPRGDQRLGLARQHFGWLLDVIQRNGDVRLATVKHQETSETTLALLVSPRDFGYASDEAREALVGSRPAWIPVAVLVADEPESFSQNWEILDDGDPDRPSAGSSGG
ncbi:hypothetical protein SK069_11755 [Patulibacter brassicae]|uniref:Uncharacterized protein n=1 Tax=Patulibacter brassicae TaxID=1705717 RepID=A0ABU4VKA4_9ACTN|nr:hypothetical protein [Patulibacter brassicae]MDX8152274.1 hypothetical protein [Patulibacter brassicae]